MGKILCIACVALALFAVFLNAEAQGLPTAFSLSATGGEYLFKKNEQLKDSPVYSLRLGYDIIGKNMTDSLGLEGSFSFINTASTQDGTSVNAYLIRIDALYPFLPRNRTVPYVAAGVGGLFVDGADAKQSPVANYGLGIKYYLKEYLAVRGDLRHLVVFDSGRRSNFEAVVGLTYLLGRDNNLKRIPLVDSDRDGVMDDQDLCPDTPRGVKVDKNGCPVDSDNDGVADYLDKCPDTPQGIKVDKTGCPEVAKPPVIKPESIDTTPAAQAVMVATVPQAAAVEPLVLLPATVLKVSEVKETSKTEAALPEPPLVVTVVKNDSTPLPVPDNIPDIICPETPPAPPVAVPNALRTVTFEFDSNSAVLKRTYRKTARELATFMKRNKGTTMIIEGHADYRGSPALNMNLSRKRALSIRNFLVKSCGAVPSTITIRPFGCRLPIDDNKTVPGRQKNRRAIVLVIVSSPGAGL